MNIKVSQLANAIRFLSIDAVQKANSGHPGMPMGLADVATVLFKYHLRFNPKNPSWIYFIRGSWLNAFILIVILNWI